MEALKKENEILHQRVENLNCHLDAAMEALFEARDEVKSLQAQLDKFIEEQGMMREENKTPAPQDASLAFQDVEYLSDQD